MLSQLLKFLVALLILSSCKTDPKRQYSKKTKIGVCQEHQGMVTFEATLYSDSTFYQPGNDLINYSYGKFEFDNGHFKFNTLGGDQNFCPEYMFDKENDSYISIGNCHSDPINIYWTARFKPY